MRKILPVVIILVLFLILGCTQEPLDKDSAAEIMEENGCWWNLSEEGVSLELEDSYWVMSINRCLGQCRVHSITKEFEKDVNPMCMGA